MAVSRNRKSLAHAQRFGGLKTFARFLMMRRIRKMARRANPQKIKIHRNYRIEDAAETLSVAVPTVRNWIKEGLPALTSKTPIFDLGAGLA